MPAYFATKHFAVALSESVYYDLQTHKDKIKMSVFCPSFVQTDLHHYERHRPARYRAPEDPYYTSEPYYREQKVAEKVITTGTPLGPVGPFVFDALERETFYIELHPNTKIMAEEAGVCASQVMLLCGTDESGLEHPHWRENLKLALYLQNAVSAAHPTLMRPVEVVPQRYNQQLSTGSLLVEVGSSGNTLQEALAGVRLFGDAAGPALAKLIE